MSRSFHRVVLACAAVMLAASASFAQETSYTTLLLPVSPSTIAGQDGARWLTELTLANNDFSEPISLFCFVGTCDPVAPRTVQRIVAPLTSTVRPGLLYVPDSVARRLTAALRSRNSTPNSTEQDFISEIPVVRESEFRSTVVEILAVPVEANYRHMLRVYDANANEGAKVRVRIYGMTNGQLVTEPLVDTELELHTARGSASPFERPDQPSWASLPNFTDLPGVRNYQELHIRIESLSTVNTELWAFVTATNNTTQRFAVYTP
jgi:hypothetical protein